MILWPVILSFVSEAAFSPYTYLSEKHHQERRYIRRKKRKEKINRRHSLYSSVKNMKVNIIYSNYTQVDPRDTRGYGPKLDYRQVVSPSWGTI